MKKAMRNCAMLPAVLAATVLLPACSEDNVTSDEADVADTDQSTQTVASALGAIPDLASFNAALSSAQIGSIFDGPGSYTVLAPNDEAFAALGEDGAALMDEPQRPVLIGVLRNHILPGHLTMDDIAAAIDARGGTVTMTTLGQGSVEFTRDGSGITVSNDTGATARLGATSTAATNGVIIPLDTVLVPGDPSN